MKTTLTRVHLALGETESGLQFEIDDGAGGTVRQRAFVMLPDDVRASVWLAAQTALSKAVDQLPVDLPPGNVTTAIMQQRTAEAAAKAAIAARKEALDTLAQVTEKNAALAEQMSAAQQQHDDLLAAKRAELADLQAKIANVVPEGQAVVVGAKSP